MKKMLHQAPQLWKGPGFILTLQKHAKKGTASDLFRLQLVVDDGREWQPQRLHLRKGYPAMRHTINR